MEKKPIVSVTYENERISIKKKKKQLTLLKMCVTSLLCGPRADLWPFYGFLCERFSLYVKKTKKTVNRNCHCHCRCPLLLLSLLMLLLQLLLLLLLKPLLLSFKLSLVAINSPIQSYTHPDYHILPYLRKNDCHSL